MEKWRKIELNKKKTLKKIRHGRTKREKRKEKKRT